MLKGYYIVTHNSYHMKDLLEILRVKKLSNIINCLVIDVVNNTQTITSI